MKYDEEATSLMMKVFFTGTLLGSVALVIVGLVAFAADVSWAWVIAVAGAVVFVFILLVKPRQHKGSKGS